MWVLSLLLLFSAEAAPKREPVVEPKLEKALISEPRGLEHLVALEAIDEGLEVIHFNETTRHYERSRIPWDVLLEGRVQYSIPKNYRVDEPGPSFRLETANKKSKMRFRLKLPPPHVLIDYTERDGMVYFATASEERVQVFSTQLPKIKSK